MVPYIAPRPQTERAYAYWLGRFQGFLEGREASLELAQGFLQSLKDKGCKDNTLILAGRAIRNKLGIPVPLPRMEFPEPNYLTVDQIKALIEASLPLERTLVTVMFDTAGRISEVMEMRVSRLRLDQGVAVVTRKGGHDEQVSLGQRSVEALREWLSIRKSHDDRVFMDYTVGQVRQRLTRTAHKLGFDFHPHLLRHSRVRQLLDSGATLEQVSEICGHKSLSTTALIYGRHTAADRARFLDQQAPW